ncbi:MAG: hypothetical protein CSA20_08480 [Deltaproteobacteria bacterium]|nr:MAG: hypothetical protein CSA20_08480 [Deltaproteobacteria bacterium]
MITTIAGAMTATMKGLGIFKAVERSVLPNIVQSPPGAAVILAYDKEVENRPTSRELGWDVMVTVSALGSGKGIKTADDIIDLLRETFINYRPLDEGVLPARVPTITLEGIQGQLLVYTVRVTMVILPAVIDASHQ